MVCVFSACAQTPQALDAAQTVLTPTPYTSLPSPTLLSASSDSTTTPVSDEEPHFGYTYQNSIGNRVVPGKGNLPHLTPIDIQLPGIPIWIAAAPYQKGALWTAVLEDGTILSFTTQGDKYLESSSQPVKIPAGMPPLLSSFSDHYLLVTVPDPEQTLLSHPIYLPRSDQRVYISSNGELRFLDSSDNLTANLDVHALPDARILSDEHGRLLVLSEPTDRYDHAVLGDNLEAGSITLIETQPEPRIIRHITLPENEVIEGIAPIWVDVTGDNQAEIIVTVSDIDLGAGIVIFSESGERLAESPKMGQPYRWRHQIGYADLGPDGVNELAVVRTPHIGGTVEYYQFNDGELSLAAEFPGITSHTIGSRNLDQAAIGDFDGDGLVELLVLNPQLSEYIAVQRTSHGAEEIWRLPLDGILSTNLAGVSLADGQIALGVGRTDGSLRLWLPKE